MQKSVSFLCAFKLDFQSNLPDVKDIRFFINALTLPKVRDNTCLEVTEMCHMLRDSFLVRSLTQTQRLNYQVELKFCVTVGPSD